MIPLLLAAVVAAGGEPQTETLADVTLGTDVAQVLSEHPEARQSANGSGRWWRWSRRGGGTVTVTADDGKITRVDFMADKGQDDNVDLPCVGAFPVQDSHVNLELALNKTPCSAFNGAGYGLPDHSLVEVHFANLSDGQLVEVTWYRPSDKNPHPVAHANAFFAYMRPALIYAGGVARVYYAGECPARDRTGLVQMLPFPLVWLEPTPQGATGTDAIRQTFRDDPNVSVVQDRSGMLRITIGSVSDLVLKTRIPSLTLDRSEQYNVLSAIDKIAFTVDIYAKQNGLPFGEAPSVIDHLVGGWIDGAPHLPATMKNVTLDDALDAVARTFGGIVVYGQCARPDGKTLFLFGFTYGA